MSLKRHIILGQQMLNALLDGHGYKLPSRGYPFSTEQVLESNITFITPIQVQKRMCSK